VAYEKLNKDGEGSFDPWPEIPESYPFESYRHELVANELARVCLPTAGLIDFGCGDGLTLRELHLRGFTDLVGIDHSEEGLRRSRAKVPGLRTICADLLNLEPQPCQVGICTEVLEHLPTDEDVQRVVDLLYASVTDLALISVPDDSICVIDSDHRRLFPRGEAERLLTVSGFKNVQTVEYFYSERYPQPWMTAIGFK
jgi:trans-aconitate methyltransferase